VLISEAASYKKPVTVSEMLARSEKLALARPDDSDEDRAAILGTIAELSDASGDSGKSAELLERALALVSHSRDSELRTRLTCHHAERIAELGQLDAATRAVTHELDNSRLDHWNRSECLNARSLIAERAGDAQGG